MHLTRQIVAFVFFTLSLKFVVCEEGKAEVIDDTQQHDIPKGTSFNSGKNSGTISMGTPDLSDEDSQSDHMPSYLKCDACRIVSMHLFDELHKAIHKYKSGPKELSEDSILDISEAVCDDKWEAHGIKEVDGVKRLSGPGFETAEIPGVMQGGGRWPFRFKKVCWEMLGNFGEEKIYRYTRDKGKDGLEKHLCYGDSGPCKSGKKKNKGKKKKQTREINEL